MSERDMTADERRDFEAEQPHHDDGGTPDAGPASDPYASGTYASGTQDDAVASAFGVEPAGRRRWTRTRSKSPATGPRPDDFNPSSRGDERGEVM